MLKPERPGVGYSLNDEMSWILEGRQTIGKRPRRRLIASRRCSTLESLVWTNLVEFGTELVERNLLRASASLGRPDRFCFERLVHSFVRAVFLR